MRRWNKFLKSSTSLVLVLAMLLGMCTSAIAVERTAGTTALNYVSLGDSMANGYGLDGAKSYPELFADKMGFNHISGAVDGMRVEDLRAELANNAELRADIANADVISLGIGHADFGIFAINSILSALEIEVPGAETVEDISSINLENALAGCNENVREFALKLYDELTVMIDNQLTDKDAVDKVLDVLMYIVINYMNNYVGVIDDIAEINEKDDLKFMIVGMINVMDDMKVDTGRGVLDIGRLMHHAVNAMNIYLATLPAVLQLIGRYNGVTFIYAADADVELMYTQFGKDGVSRELLIDQICKDLFSLMGEGFSVTVDVPVDKFGDLSDIPGLEDIGNSVEVSVTIKPEAVTLAEVEQYEKYIAGETTAVGMTVNKMYSCALCKAFEDAICSSNDLDVVSLETVQQLTAGLNSIFADLTADLKADVLSKVTGDLMDAALAEYETWAKIEGGKGEEIAERMLAELVEELVKDYEDEESGLSIIEAYLKGLNILVEKADELVGLKMEKYTEDDILWDDLYASLIADGTDAEREAGAREVFEAHIYEDLVAAAIEFGMTEAEKSAREYAVTEFEKQVRAKIREEAIEVAKEELADELWNEAVTQIENEVRAEMEGIPGVTENDIKAKVEEIVEEKKAEIEEEIAATIESNQSEIETAVDAELVEREDEIKAAVEDALVEYADEIEAEIQKALDENKQTIETEATKRIDDNMNVLWNLAWEKLEELYDAVKTNYDEKMAEYDYLMEKAWLLPLSLLLQNLDNNDPKKADQAIVSDVVLTPIAEQTAPVITESLGQGLAVEPLKTVLYLFGRTLLADGLGYHPSAAGHEEIANAMVAKYESGETVQDELFDATIKLVDLLNKYGSKILNNGANYTKLNNALDKLAEKLNGRVDGKVLTAIEKAKEAVDKIEAIIIDGEELSSKAVIADLKRALENLDKAVDAIFELVGKDVPADVLEAMAKFQDEYLRATSGVYELYNNSYYVAIGDNSIVAEGVEKSYTDLLAEELKELGLNEEYQNLAAASIEETIASLKNPEVLAEIERADIITIGYSNNSMFDFMAERMKQALNPENDGNLEPLNWDALVGAEAAQYIKEALKQIGDSLAYEGLDKFDIVGVNSGDMLMLAIESYAYASISYTVNYPTLIEKIREVNPYGLIVAVGMSNTAADINLDMSKYRADTNFNLGNYVEYLVEIANYEALACAMLGENIIFVEAPDVDIIAGANDYDDVDTFIRTVLFGNFKKLYASAEGHEYIKNQILNVLDIAELEILGDVNFDGKVTGADTNLIFRYVCGTVQFNERQLRVADVNHDGKVSGADTNLVFRYVAELLPYLGAPVN